MYFDINILLGRKSSISPMCNLSARKYSTKRKYNQCKKNRSFFSCPRGLQPTTDPGKMWQQFLKQIHWKFALPILFDCSKRLLLLEFTTITRSASVPNLFIVKALVKLHICVGSPGISLLAYVPFQVGQHAIILSVLFYYVCNIPFLWWGSFLWGLSETQLAENTTAKYTISTFYEIYNFNIARYNIFIHLLNSLASVT